MLTHLARTLATIGKRNIRDSGEPRRAYEDVELTSEGFSIPELKWRELLFIGAVRQEGDSFVRDASRPLPRFRFPDLFVDDARYRVRHRAGRVELRRHPSGKKRG
jgi:hypothetical protein